MIDNHFHWEFVAYDTAVHAAMANAAAQRATGRHAA